MRRRMGWLGGLGLGMAATVVLAAEPSATPPSTTVAIPAGSFWLGCNEAVDDECADDEKPGREVAVDAFRIDRTEVSARRYAECVAADACTAAPTAPECTAADTATTEHPINCIDWSEAQAFCTWAGGRLPSEAEWEKAARGSDRRKYPWGNTGIPEAGLVANICDAKCSLKWKLKSYADGYAQTAPVGSFPAGASAYGVLDMGGNVWEWTADTYAETTSRVIRGGSWNNQARNTRVSIRTSLRPEARAATVGVRCVY